MDKYRISSKTSPIIIKFPSISKKEECVSNLNKTVPDETDVLNIELFPLRETRSQKVLTKSLCVEKNFPIIASVKKRPAEPVSFRIVKKQRPSLITHLSKLSNKKLDSVHGGDESKLSKLPKPPYVMQLSNFNSDKLLDIGNDRGGIQKSESLSLSSGLDPTFPKEQSIDNPSCSSSDSCSKKTKESVCPYAKLEPPLKKLKFSLIKKVLTGNSVKNIFSLDSDNFDTKCNQSTSENSDIKLPLVMQSSNLLSDNVLDVRHDRGGIETSKRERPEKLDNAENPPKQEVSEDNKVQNEVECENNSAKESSESISSNIESKKVKQEKSHSYIQLDSNDSFIDNLYCLNDSKESGLQMSPSNIQQTINDKDIFNIFPLKIEPEESELKTPISISKLQTGDHIYSFQTPEIKLENHEFQESSSLLSESRLTNVDSDIQNISQSSVDILPFETYSDNKSSIFIQLTDKCIDPLLNDSAHNEKESSNIHDLKQSVRSPDKKDLASVEKKEESDRFTEQNDLSLINSSLPEYINDDDSLNNSINCLESCKTFNHADNTPESVQNDDSCSNQLDNQVNSDEPSMVFDILDEFESNENDPEEMDSGEDDSDISTDEIDAMLEAGLGDYSKRSENNILDHEEKEKVILKVRGRDHFDVLPEGWIEVTHNSGMPIYLHKQTRVCCVSKPYFLGPGSTRKHEIPLSAIPCLHYLKELEKEKAEKAEKIKQEAKEAEKIKQELSNGEDKIICSETNGISGNPIDVTLENSLNFGETMCVENGNTISSDMNKVPENSNGPGIIFPSAKLQSVKDLKVSGSLDYLAVREYCEKRFEFQTITVKRFKTWSGRRLHQKQMKRKQRPFLPDSTKLITCPLPSSADKSTTVGSISKREFIMNPTGKSPVCILHEYVQHTLRVQPKYIFKELESASTPYGAVVIINDMEYGTGYGSSKKVAKSEAAKSALEVLIPKIRKFAPDNRNSDDDDELQDVEFFDQVRVEDPRVCDLSVKAGQPYPYQILLECLKRNYGMGDTEVSIKMHNLKHQKNEFVMKVGKHSATVVCKNKRDGKQRASQSILQQLHPHINSWGSLLRMYGKGSCKTLKEKKEEEQRITELQTKACANKPNMSILNKLKEEMLKYREKMKSKKPIGKLIPERMHLLSVSDSNLKNIEL